MPSEEIGMGLKKRRPEANSNLKRGDEEKRGKKRCARKSKKCKQRKRSRKCPLLAKLHSIPFLGA